MNELNECKASSFLSSTKCHTELHRKWKNGIFNGETTLVLESLISTLFFFLFAPSLLSTFSFSLSLSCTESFMFRSEEPATYHGSLERLSYKSWRHMPDLTGHTQRVLYLSFLPLLSDIPLSSFIKHIFSIQE